MQHLSVGGSGHNWLLVGVVLVLLTSSVTAAEGPQENIDDEVRPGAVAIEPPTVRSIGLEWEIGGDLNRNASVEVYYRQAGSTDWREGLPLFRLHNETVPAENATDPDNANRPPEESAFYYVTPNMFTGSIFDLQPDTSYEVRMRMLDPDGVRGQAEQSVEVRTRPIPRRYGGGDVYHVYPVGWEGLRDEPSFEGLLRAYNYGAEHADWNHAYEPRVRPGDTVMVHAGEYKADRFEYGNYTRNGPGVGGPGYGVPFDGTYLLTGQGTAERPITIMASGDGEVWFDGDGNHMLFNVQVADYHIFDGINIRNTNIAYDAGIKRIAGARGLTIVNSRIEEVGVAVQTDFEGSRDFYIADNTIVGRVSADNLVGWTGAGVWVDRPDWPADLSSFQGIRLYGPGHVVEYNTVERFHDGIALATFGRPGTLPDLQPDPAFIDRLDFDPRYVTGPNSVDIMNNDIRNISDICIEPDGGARNIRILRNRCVNVASTAMRSQPAFGGPHYYIRNLVYHAPRGTTLGASSGSSGQVMYNNTVFGGIGATGSNHHFLNNLVVTAMPGSRMMDMSTFTSYSSSDYNGFVPGANGSTLFRWRSPNGVPQEYDLSRLSVREYDSLVDYQMGTGQDVHSVLLTLDVFVDVVLPDIDNPSALYDGDDFDFSLVSGSSAIDAGLALPGVTDRATGNAPDLGALEVGIQVPHYGRRN